MSIVLMRSVLLYITVIFAVRLMGKRQLGELQPSELVITILVSNIATLILEDINIPLAVGVAPILSLVCFEVLSSWLCLKIPKLRVFTCGRPKIIISNGVVDKTQMKELRFSVDDLMTALRTKDIFSLKEVQYAIVETTGSLSVMKKPQYDTPTQKDLGVKNKANNPPQLVIEDGKILTRALNSVHFDEYWLKTILKNNNLKVSDVFLMQVDETGNYYIAEQKNILRRGKYQNSGNN